MFYIVVYLFSIILANLVVAFFGKNLFIIVLVAMVSIGLSIYIRDELHEIWQHHQLKLKMFLLISTGSLLTVLLNWGAWRIAIASCVAFAGTAIVDTLVYHKLLAYPKWLKVNGSNIPSALVDSVLFPLIAFGCPPFWLAILGQFLAKVLGGFFWSMILGGLYDKS